MEAPNATPISRRVQRLAWNTRRWTRHVAFFFSADRLLRQIDLLTEFNRRKTRAKLGEGISIGSLRAVALLTWSAVTPRRGRTVDEPCAIGLRNRDTGAATILRVGHSVSPSNAFVPRGKTLGRDRLDLIEEAVKCAHGRWRNQPRRNRPWSSPTTTKRETQNNKQEGSAKVHPAARILTVTALRQFVSRDAYQRSCAC